MARHVDLVAHKLDLHVMHVQNFGEFAHQRPELLFEGRVAQNPATWFDGGRLALNVGKDGRDLRYIPANLRLQARDYVMSILKAQGFVELQMLLHVEPPGEILYAHVMHAEVVS